MKLPPILSGGMIAVALLAMLTMAHAQNSQPKPIDATVSSLASPTFPPAPMPAPAPPPMSASTARGARATRGPANNLAETASRATTRRGAMAANTSWTSEIAMNDAFVVQFNNTGSFGGGRMPAPTMRIDPQMRLLITEVVPVKGAANVVQTAYRINSLELIGMAMHDTPVAFVVVRHKDNSAHLNNRVLTDFEVGALKQLVTGQEVVNEQTKSERLLVGAVRAEASCINCHDGAKVGDVLGAFSYHLSLVDMPPTPATTRAVTGTAPQPAQAVRGAQAQQGNRGMPGGA